MVASSTASPMARVAQVLQKTSSGIFPSQGLHHGSCFLQLFCLPLGHLSAFSFPDKACRIEVQRPSAAGRQPKHRLPP